MASPGDTLEQRVEKMTIQIATLEQWVETLKTVADVHLEALTKLTNMLDTLVKKLQAKGVV